MGTSRLEHLSNAITEYGDASMRIYESTKKIGHAIRARIGPFLGSETRVFGVPPAKEWSPNTDYRDAMFSYYGGGTLTVGPAEIGLAIQIPHKSDSGSLWIRVTLEITPTSGNFRVVIGEGWRSIDVQSAATAEEIEEICLGIYDYLMSMFSDPVAAATSAAAGRIGFHTEPE